MKEWTKDTHRALGTAFLDPEFREAFQKLKDGQFETALNLARESGSEDEAFRSIKHYVLHQAPNETARRQADQEDLGLRNLTEDELALLRFAPQGKALITQMRDGDEEAVAQAKSLLKEIKRVREDLGLL